MSAHKMFSLLCIFLSVVNINARPQNILGNSQISSNTQNINSNGGFLLDLLDIKPQILGDINLLSSQTQSSSGGILAGGSAGNVISNSQSQNNGLNLDGNDNLIVQGAQVNPEVLLDVDLLNNVVQKVTGGGGSASGGAANVIKNSQTNKDKINVKGDGNILAQLAEVNPAILGNIGILSSQTQSSSGGILAGGSAGNVISNSQSQNNGLNLDGNDNLIVQGAQVNPEVLLDVGLLNNVVQKVTGSGGSVSGGAANVIKNSQTNKDKINVKGDGNILAQLAEVNPTILGNIGILSSQTQSSSGGVLAGGSAGNVISNSQSQNNGLNLDGNDNLIVQGAQVNPEVLLDVGLLNNVVQKVTGSGGSVSGGAANVIKNSQTNKDKINVKGDGNILAQLAEVNPAILGNIGILSSQTQSSSGGILAGGSAENVISNSQSQNNGLNLDGNDNLIVQGAQVNPEVLLDVGLLNNVVQKVTGSGGSVSGGAANVIKNSQTNKDKINVKGDGNILAQLAEVNPTILGNIGILSSQTQSSSGGVLAGGSAGNVISNSQSQNNGLNLDGNDNLIVQGAQVNPEVLLDVGLLNNVVQSVTGSGTPINGVAGPASGGAANVIKNSQSSNDVSNVNGDGNAIVQLAKVEPQVLVSADILGQVGQVLDIVRDPTILLTAVDGTQADCQNVKQSVQEQNSVTNVNGNDNILVQGANISPQVNVDLNLLTSLVQSGQCKIRTTPKPPTSPPTPRPPTIAPPTLKPPKPSPPTPRPPKPSPPTPRPPTIAPPTLTPPKPSPPTPRPPTPRPPTPRPPTIAPPTSRPPKPSPPTPRPPKPSPPTPSPPTIRPPTLPPKPTPPAKRCFRRVCRKCRENPQYKCY